MKQALLDVLRFPSDLLYEIHAAFFPATFARSPSPPTMLQALNEFVGALNVSKLTSRHTNTNDRGGPML